jgi:phospholipid-binding lipoprotein MlaA
MTAAFDSRRHTALTLALAVSLLVGCATSGNPRDPIEGFNRAMFDLNDGLDKALVKPVAQGYEAALPAPVRKGVTNFFDNIGDVLIAVNNVLQGKLPEAASDVGRIAVNTTIGMLGVIDVASSLGLEKHEEDFGQTFGRWGLDNGPYLVLPVLGPSTLRDATGLTINQQLDPVRNYHNVSSRNVMLGTRTLDTRAGLLAIDKIVDEAALDRYAYVREAYLQRRRNQIYDGDPPRESENAASAALPQTTTQAQARTTPFHREPVLGSANLYVEWPNETPAATLMSGPAPLLTDPLAAAKAS